MNKELLDRIDEMIKEREEMLEILYLRYDNSNHAAETVAVAVQISATLEELNRYKRFRKLMVGES